MNGIAYGVGVGPGDPELMTLKAARLIRENSVIAFPGKTALESMAYQIAAAAVPEIAGKELLALEMPMTRDRQVMEDGHRRGADLIESYLKRGINVVYLTIGDPTVYCTFSYVQHLLEADGFTVKLISGVPSFCAAAARLNEPLTEWDESLHIIPASHKAEALKKEEGSFVLMKSASHMAEVKEKLKALGFRAGAVENCGLKTEKVYRSLEEIPDDAGYFSVIIAKADKADML